MTYSYAIYSAVFLSRAYRFGALNTEQVQLEIAQLIRLFISAMKMAATSEEHIGHRYRVLINKLRLPIINKITTGCHQNIVRHTKVSDDIHPENAAGLCLGTESLEYSVDSELLGSTPNWTDSFEFGLS